MSSTGRMHDALHSLLWEQDNGYHPSTPGLLKDKLSYEEVRNIEDEIMDMLRGLGWKYE